MAETPNPPKINRVFPRPAEVIGRIFTKDITDATYSILSEDNMYLLRVDRVTDVTITVPSGLGIGFNCEILQVNTGQAIFVGSGTTINTSGTALKTRDTDSLASLVMDSPEVFTLSGDVEGVGGGGSVSGTEFIIPVFDNVGVMDSKLSTFETNTDNFFDWSSFSFIPDTYSFIVNKNTDVNWVLYDFGLSRDDESPYLFFETYDYTDATPTDHYLELYSSHDSTLNSGLWAYVDGNGYAVAALTEESNNGYGWLTIKSEDANNRSYIDFLTVFDQFSSNLSLTNNYFRANAALRYSQMNTPSNTEYIREELWAEAGNASFYESLIANISNYDLHLISGSNTVDIEIETNDTTDISSIYWEVNTFSHTGYLELTATESGSVSLTWGCDTAFIYSDFTRFYGDLLYQNYVSPKTANYNVLGDDSAAVFTNEGTTAKRDFTLPTAEAGLIYTFIVQDSDGLRVVAGAGDTIRLGSSVSAVAGNIDSTTIGSSVTLKAINTTEWIATSIVGNWVIN